MREVTIQNPPQVAFGPHCVQSLSRHLTSQGYTRIYLLTIAPLLELLSPQIQEWESQQRQIEVDLEIEGEPSLADFERSLAKARSFAPDCVVGIGGGSVLDVAKLVAAQLHNTQETHEVVGIGRLQQRDTPLICIPTTSGTGSEMSPNAIFVDDEDESKKAVISPFLLPDAVYIDPVLTCTLPPEITAATGIDALTHCLEAYANRFAHPMIDTIALKGVALISRHLQRAVDDGSDLEARCQVALGSMYGGMCLGPVNTAAIHALSYPLGTRFHIPHGLSNALLMPYVSQFNVEAAPERYADIAVALGADRKDTPEATAQDGIDRMRILIADCQLPARLSELKIAQEEIPNMAREAIKIQRLLKNNVREVSLADAESIYRNAY